MRSSARTEGDSATGRKRGLPSSAPEFPADYYRRIHEIEEHHWWHRGMRVITGALLEDQLRQGGRLLDVGCGTGGFLSWALQQGSFDEIAGADISAEAVALAGERVPEAELRVAPIWELPFETGSFDVIVLNDVLQHVPDTEVARSLREMRRLLRTEGTLLVRTNGALRARSDGDWRVYDRATLRSTLQQADFACERLTYANMAGSLWAGARGTTPRAPSSDRHGIPSLPSPRANALMYGLLRAEASYLRRSPVGLPYGHTLFAVAAPASADGELTTGQRKGNRAPEPNPRIRGAREQMPGRLAKIDDSRGIAWRLHNVARRASPKLAARFVWAYLRGVRYERPIFIIGASRSGTTMVFDLLKASSALEGLPGEGHDVWRAFHHPRWSGWDSDVVGAESVRFGERRFVNAYFYAHLGRCRLVDKTPENSLRVPYLLDLFPDATFVTVRRDPCEVISSIINGWRDPGGRFRSYYVPEKLAIPGHPHQHMWSFALIEGWRDYMTRPVPEIAFAQWEQLTGAIEEARPLVDSSRWVDVHFEDLIERPEAALSAIRAATGIEDEPRLRTTLAELRAKPVNALSPAGAGKWRAENGREVEELLPRIVEVAPSRGYTIDPTTGDCRLRR